MSTPLRTSQPRWPAFSGLLAGRRPRRHGATTPLLGCDVGQRLVEHPLVTEWVIYRGLPLAVFPVMQRIDLGGAASLGRLDNGPRVGDLEHHLMRTALAGDAPPRPHLGDDELRSRFARKSKLRSMPLPDTHMLHETEDLAIPSDRRADVGDGQHRSDTGVRCRTVRQHPTKLDRPVTLGNRGRNPIPGNYVDKAVCEGATYGKDSPAA